MAFMDLTYVVKQTCQKSHSWPLFCEKVHICHCKANGFFLMKAGLPVAAAKLAAGGHDENAGPAAGVAGAAAASAGGGHDGKSSGSA